jgi:hypothetical protein
MAWASTVPAAITGLMAQFTLAGGLAGVDIRDGPALGNEAATEVLSVGWQGDTEGAAVTNEPTAEGLAAAPDRERYSVHCAVAVLDGGADVATARARAYEIQAAAGAAILEDQTLGGAVMNAMTGATHLRQQQGEHGVTVTVLFDVDCDAFTGR